jgi:hypothetical protein
MTSNFSSGKYYRRLLIEEIFLFLKNVRRKMKPYRGGAQIRATAASLLLLRVYKSQKENDAREYFVCLAPPIHKNILPRERIEDYHLWHLMVALFLFCGIKKGKNK